jgi:hypothetical protein
MYPDCETKREVAPGKWQRCRIEFEYESKNFLRHGHDPKKCDVIVCWRHNWKECPEEIEVIELSRVLGCKNHFESAAIASESAEATDARPRQGRQQSSSLFPELESRTA